MKRSGVFFSPVLAFAGFVVGAAASPAAAQVFIPAPAQAAPLECPERLSGFTRVRADDAACVYEAPRAGAVLTRGGAAPVSDGAPLGDAGAPPPWSAAAFHLGETDAGDGREEIWITSAGEGGLAVTLRYAIPGFAPAEARAFVLAAGAANGVVAVEESAPGPDCAAELAGFTLEEAVTGERAGAGVLSGCIYLRGGASVLLYTARSADTAAEDFATGLSDDAEPGNGPSVAGARATVALTAGIWRGQWIVETADGARVAEADWPPGGAGVVQAFLDAAF